MMRLRNTVWKSFPKRELPRKPTTKINVGLLEKRVGGASHKWTVHKKDRALRAISHLRKGAPAYQLKPLKGTVIKNAESANTYGAEFRLEKWIEQEFSWRVHF
jgi:hypothetical protein